MAYTNPYSYVTASAYWKSFKYMIFEKLYQIVLSFVFKRLVEKKLQAPPKVICFDVVALQNDSSPAADYWLNTDATVTITHLKKVIHVIESTYIFYFLSIIF